MKILLSSIGSRGDVQPLVALGQALVARGHNAQLCVAPNFRGWVESFGLECVPIGPDLEQWSKPQTTPRPASAAFSAAGTVHEQFQVLGEHSRDCEAIVAAGVLQLAARSVATLRGIPCVFAAYAPVSLRSDDHPPPKMMPPFPSLTLAAEENRAWWQQDGERWNQLFGAALNDERARVSLPPVDDVYAHIAGDAPWLACDPVLGPMPRSDLDVAQVGAWLIKDESDLPGELQRFLDSGEAPIYFGFGSMRAAEAASADVIAAARALGRRALVCGGWGGMRIVDAGTDCLVIDAVNHARLFPRVAAVVHHGGAGTTTTAAAAGAPQVIVPHVYDQYFWARRIEQLGIGRAGPARADLSTELLARALQPALEPDIRRRAETIAAGIEREGAAKSAVLLEQIAGGARAIGPGG